VSLCLCSGRSPPGFLKRADAVDRFHERRASFVCPHSSSLADSIGQPETFVFDFGEFVFFFQRLLDFYGREGIQIISWNLTSIPPECAVLSFCSDRSPPDDCPLKVLPPSLGHSFLFCLTFPPHTPFVCGRTLQSASFEASHAPQRPCSTPFLFTRTSAIRNCRVAASAVFPFTPSEFLSLFEHANLNLFLQPAPQPLSLCFWFRSLLREQQNKNYGGPRLLPPYLSSGKVAQPTRLDGLRNFPLWFAGFSARR